jgi:hypothetical protein
VGNTACGAIGVHSILDPDGMTVDKRDREVARLFATAILRLQARPSGVTSSSKKTPESSAHPLELSDETRLSVTRG